MAVNTAALKTFAPAMRRQLMEAVGRKLDLLLNSQTPDTLSTYAKQIAELRDEQEKSREQLLERVAYTWFNRLCALRYLDAKGWHPFGCRVLMPADGNETQPELLKLMRSGSLPADLKAFTNEQRLNQLLDGQIPTAIPASDAQGEVYRELVLAACRSYHNLLPDLFEGLDDASELLLPDDLLTEGSIAGSFRGSISDSDCDDVEIIGWLYQFYISEKKDEVIGKVVKSEDIPAATQLFTPNWIVKYMVQNTIGAQWLATYPDSPLREQMEFYIEPAEQTDEVNAKLAEITPTSLNPEELTLMDPACGSGHILVEAYEIFKVIYLEQGYQLREIPKLILEKNLFGLDIDQRAAQLSNFCLIMKGRADDRRLLDREISINVIALKDSSEFDAQEIAQHIDLEKNDLHINDLLALKKLFANAPALGSLICIPEVLNEKVAAIKRLTDTANGSLLTSKILKYLRLMLQQAELLQTKYDVVATNPPYLDRLDPYLRSFASKEYASSKANTYSMFIDRCNLFCHELGSYALITLQGWMFLTTFNKFREEFFSKNTVISMLHLGAHAFDSIGGEVVSCTAFVAKNKPFPRYQGIYFRLLDGVREKDKADLFKSSLKGDLPNIRYTQTSDIFDQISGRPLAYWISQKASEKFKSLPQLGESADPRCGMMTNDNNRFLRYWYEVSHDRIGYNLASRDAAKESKKYWFPYNKGGASRKWYGNNLFLVLYYNDGFLIKETKRRNLEAGLITANNSKCWNQEFYFRPCLTWSALSNAISVRRCGPGFIFDTKGQCLFTEKIADLPINNALLNSRVSEYFLNILTPTLDFNSGYLRRIPDAIGSFAKRHRVVEIEQCCTRLAKDDWDSFEISWDFLRFPLLNKQNLRISVQESWEQWDQACKIAFVNMKAYEEEINHHFINLYELQEELDSEVSEDKITLNRPELSDGTISLISYATGCMMGRYSLDHPGLILADSRSNQEEQLAAYEAKVGKPISEIQFKPDADAIIPVLDGEWFEDDIVARTREFLKVTFPESSVAENLRFIEDSISKDIRKYFCKDFYKDHLQTYKKRPIYWMVQSPKSGFACLIYLHRYTPDTLLQVLNNYFRPYLQKLEARHEQLERDQNNDALPKPEQTAARKEAEKITKVLKECQAWEQDALLPLAQQRIELDLDDGVKVNYLKLQEVLAKIPGLAAKGD